MILNLKQIFEVVGATKPFEFSLDLSELELWGEKPFQTPVKINGKAENCCSVVTLAYTAEFTLNATCANCLKSIEKEFSLPFNHVIVRELNDTENDELIYAEDDTIVLDELVTSDVLLNIPFKILCKDDCKGLCPICGADKNENPCDCKPKSGNSHFSALKELFD